MNERIRELMLECYSPYSNFDHEKFAKLIAQDCANLCDLYAMPDGTSETAIILARAIRSKFGVDNE
jgi:hypothetical protein